MATDFFQLTDLGLEASPTTLLQQWLTTMQTVYPDYEPSSGNLEFVQAQIFASWAADLAQLCSSGATSIFRTYGTELIGLPPMSGSTASAVVTVTALPLTTPLATLSSSLSTSGAITSLPVAPLGYTVEAGSIVLTDSSSGNTQTWSTPGAALGQTSIPVASQTPNFAYPIGATITGVAQYTLPSGTQMTLQLGGVPVGFQTFGDVAIDSGTTATISVSAIEPGSAANGAAGPVVLITPLIWVDSTDLVTQASGGTDVEDDDHYLSRLTETLRLLAPRPITASDYSVMAQNFTPITGSDQEDVGRVTSIDGYDPNSNTYNNEREVTVCVADANGNPLNTDTMYGIGGSPTNIITDSSGWGVAGWLESLREVNFIVNVVAPNYTQVYVTVTVKALPGWPAATIQANVQEALLGFLNPASWGFVKNKWINTSAVYVSQIESIIQQCGGVSYVVQGSLAVGFAPSPTNTSFDLTLPGPFPLPVSSSSTIPLTAVTVL